MADLDYSKFVEVISTYNAIDATKYLSHGYTWIDTCKELSREGEHLCFTVARTPDVKQLVIPDPFKSILDEHLKSI